MSSHFNVYLGPYIVCEWEKVEKKEFRYYCPSCQTDKEPTLGGRFCPLCGSEYKYVNIPRLIHNTLFNFDESEMLTSVNEESNSPFGTLISNMTFSDLANKDGEDFPHVPITQEMITKSLAEFSEKFIDTIENVRKNTKSVDIRFGLVQYYM